MSQPATNTSIEQFVSAADAEGTRADIIDQFGHNPGVTQQYEAEVATDDENKVMWFPTGTDPANLGINHFEGDTNYSHQYLGGDGEVNSIYTIIAADQETVNGVPCDKVHGISNALGVTPSRLFDCAKLHPGHDAYPVLFDLEKIDRHEGKVLIAPVR